MSPTELLNHALELVENFLTEAQRSNYGRELRDLDEAVDAAVADDRAMHDPAFIAQATGMSVEDAAGCAGKHEAVS
jgi:hypothetical protein